MNKFIQKIFPQRWDLSISTRVRLLVILVVILPTAGTLILLESKPDLLSLLLATYLLAGIILMVPLSTILSHLLILKDMKDLERFCNIIKSGNYDVRLSLPPEKEHEHEIMVLKRNLNWMAQAISMREAQLENELEKTSKEKDRFLSISMLDPLTGLYNRRGLEVRLEEIVKDPQWFDQPITLMFLDADKFKSVNDTFGHQAGDELLQRLAAILRDNVRSQVDIPFRFGGDEFGVLMVGLKPSQAQSIALRVLRVFNQSRIGETTLSVGIAEYVRSNVSHDADAARLIKQADSAAYQAKKQGGDRVVIADPTAE